MVELPLVLFVLKIYKIFIFIILLTRKINVSQALKIIDIPPAGDDVKT